MRERSLARSIVVALWEAAGITALFLIATLLISVTP